MTNLNDYNNYAVNIIILFTNTRINHSGIYCGRKYSSTLTTKFVGITFFFFTTESFNV